jgi:hypothetical protein
MTIEEQIKDYISSQPEAKREDMELLHRRISELQPSGALWFLDGKNSEGKIISNPNIGYGTLTLSYADGSSKAFYRVGLSANTTGISVYIMGLTDKTYLATTYGPTLGKASVTGYCIKFKTLSAINLDVLVKAVNFGLHNEV